MKFIISESQKDRVVFKYLNYLNLAKIEKQNNIYFLKSEEDKFSEIKFNKNDGNCLIYFDLIAELSSFFSLRHRESKLIIGRWVQDTTQMDVNNIITHYHHHPFIVENN